jgi:CheY-like chemotaxis protein
MLGWLQMLETQALDTDRARHAIRVVHRNARHQAQLIDDILDISRITSGRMDIVRQSVSVPDLVESVLESVEGAAGTRGILVTRSVEANLPSVEGDLRRLHQALGNVVGNAVKFTPPGGRVRLQVTAVDSQVQIVVRDTGVGIAPAALPHVFERFRQGGTNTRGHGGLGLGLAIARFLIEAHGGTISVASEGPGRGTTVRIVLPASVAAPAAEEQPSPAWPGLAGLTVLIVDDHDDARAMLSALLEGYGSIVYQAESAQTALARLADTSIALLIADIAMPGMDGYELIRTIRSGSTRGPAAVAVSAYARPEDRDRALQAGYDAYCVKPVSQVELLRVIADLQEREQPRAEPPAHG